MPSTRSSTAHSITSNNEMMELVTDIEQRQQRLGRGPVRRARGQAKLPEQVSSPASPDQVVRRSRARQRRRCRGTLRAEARDDQAAENLRDVVRGFLALARMQAQADPRSAARWSNRCSCPAPARPSRSRSRVPAEILQHDSEGGASVPSGGAAGEVSFSSQLPASSEAAASEDPRPLCFAGQTLTGRQQPEASS